MLVQARTITLKTKNINFTVHSRAETVSRPVASCEDLYHTASHLLRTEIANNRPAPLRLRLMGMYVYLRTDTGLTHTQCMHMQVSRCLCCNMSTLRTVLTSSHTSSPVSHTLSPSHPPVHPRRKELPSVPCVGGRHPVTMLY